MPGCNSCKYEDKTKQEAPCTKCVPADKHGNNTRWEAKDANLPQQKVIGITPVALDVVSAFVTFDDAAKQRIRGLDAAFAHLTAQRDAAKTAALPSPDELRVQLVEAEIARMEHRRKAAEALSKPDPFAADDIAALAAVEKAHPPTPARKSCKGCRYQYGPLCGIPGPDCLSYARFTPYENDPPQPTEGVKFDQGKPRMDLLDPTAIEQLAQVLTFGAQKYDAHNWRKGISTSRLLAAAFRHLFAYLRGEDKDPESGLSHVAHAMCCCMFLLGLAHRTELDDRAK